VHGSLNDLKKLLPEFRSPSRQAIWWTDRNVPEGVDERPASVAFTLQKGAISSPITADVRILLSDHRQAEPTADEIARLRKDQGDPYGPEEDESLRSTWTLMTRYEKKGGYPLRSEAENNPLQPQSPLGS